MVVSDTTARDLYLRARREERLTFGDDDDGHVIRSSPLLPVGTGYDLGTISDKQFNRLVEADAVDEWLADGHKLPNDQIGIYWLFGGWESGVAVQFGEDPDRGSRRRFNVVGSPHQSLVVPTDTVLDRARP